LNGEAYFSVVRKGNFEVQYGQGNVRVLGTKFDILSSGEHTSVKCFEGKVEVVNAKENTVIEKGQGVRYNTESKMEKFVVNEDPQNTVSGGHRFDNAPLNEVCTSLSLFYGIKIVPENVDMNRNFSGRYSLTGLDTALKLVFDPMSIDYRKEGNTVFIKNK
jgi:ferric-dicitrate binding protein FerR (iron transport regulator)